MIKRISVDQVDIGMYIVGLDRTWIDTPFLCHRFFIKTKDQIDKLISHNITYVDIDNEKGKDYTDAVPTEIVNHNLNEEIKNNIHDESNTESDSNSDSDSDSDSDSERISYEKELIVSRKIHKEVCRVIEDTMNDIRIGRNIDVEKVNVVVNNMVESLERNMNTLLSLSRLKSYDQYTFSHSVNVAILSLAMGRHMGYSKGALQVLGIGALLHDVGKMHIPEIILKKPGQLSDEEFKLIKRHVEFGVEILSKTEDIPPESLKIISDHHERFDGKGYQKGLCGGELTASDIIVGMADSFDALTTDRPYQKGILPYQGLRRLYTLNESFSRFLVEKFIQCMGIYPVGSLVQLSSKEIAIVMMINHKKLLCPKVRIIFDKDRNRVYENKILDLYEKNGNINEIIGVVDPIEIGVNPNNYIENL